MGKTIGTRWANSHANLTLNTQHWWMTGLATLLLTGCQSLSLALLPDNAHQNRPPPIIAQPATTPTKSSSPLFNLTANPDPEHQSGYHVLATSNEAYGARRVLSQQAQQTIDIQYYIWHNDKSGKQMLREVFAAGKRGVQVRLLLDDLNTDGELDQVLSALDAQPNIAVRLMNPKPLRGGKSLNFVVGAPRYHRRMHNKSMTFDGTVSIIGGRNIGDEYLTQDSATAFADLDIALAGKAAQAIEASFEEYWHSPLAYDIARLVKPNSQAQAKALAELSALSQPPNSFADRRLFQQVFGSHPWQWAIVDVFADPAAKLLKQDTHDQRIVRRLTEVVGVPQRRLSLVSSYFVPTRRGVATLTQLAQRGVDVRVLTNALSATDVPIVQAGYSKHRVPLLRGGVHLYELKPTADLNPTPKTNSRRANHRFTQRARDASTSLHSKAFAVDERLVFIGSYNLDPRSANINTELGVVVYDAALARQFHQALDEINLTNSYRLLLNQHGQIVWQSLDDGTEHDTTHEPYRKPVVQELLKIATYLPIEWLL
ncbi:phospholipase D-like domain-containing protein [Faucicola atlantae]|uniref:phospholipase D-like domain-containing protein n=1 Tax=Faucicola atlantae TaxID=34059 RepID=UPI0025B0EE32|nr:phospholipase D family protein [Moraxella atlantae]